MTTRMRPRLRGCLSASLLWPLLAVAAGEPRIEQVMKRTPDPGHGAALFAQCAECPGGDGGGTPEGATPRIAGQHRAVVIEQLLDFRTGKRRNFRMEKLADGHHLPGAQDIADVAAYVSGLVAEGAAGTGDGTRATAGALLFGRQCAACHGADGAGNAAKRVPRLGGQHYGYLVRQMYAAVDQRRPTLAEMHAGRIAPLDYDQVRGIADYLSRVVPMGQQPSR